MKPKSQSELSGPGQVDQVATALSVPVTEVSDDLEPKLPAEVLGPQAARPPRRQRPVWRRTFSVSILAVALLAGALLAMHVASANKQAGLSANQASSSLQVKSQTIPLSTLNLKPLGSLAQANALTVNGNVDVNNSVVLSPTAAPSGAVAGQLYFDQQKNQLGYYNGTSFMYLQGVSGGLAGNNVSNVHNVTNVNNVTNIYNFTNAVTGPPGVIPMFDGTGLTDSMISQVGNTISTGTGVENVTIGSTNGASNTIVQGGSGNVAINTGAVTGTSGTITIESGASSTTAAGDVNIDTGGSIINGTLIADKTFEDGTTDNMGDGIYGDNSGISASTAQAHNGIYSLAVSVGSLAFPSWGVGDGVSNPPYIIPVIAGHTYALQAWVRAGTNSDTITASVIWSNDGYGGGGEISQQDFGTVTDNSSGWQKVAGVLTAPIGAYSMGFYFSSNDAQTVGEVHYFDDISITDLTTSPSEAAVNIGTTNAQVITIGNSGMLAPTSIYGSGINLSAGAGFITGTSDYLSLSGSTGGNITSSTGALTLSSGTSASWGIGGGLYGGSLTLHGGSAGGNNNGGDLILEGGAGAGTGSSGGVIVKPPTDTTNAFQVQNASSQNLLTVDTANTEISLGVGAGNSFGYTASGNVTGSAIPSGQLMAYTFTSTAGGTLKSMSVYAMGQTVAPNNQFQLAIYSDNGGSPGSYLGSTAIGTLNSNATTQWYTLPLTSPVTLSASTSYWLVYWDNSNANALTFTSGTSTTSASSAYTWQAGADNGLPATFPSGSVGADALHSIYATYDANGPALTINSSGQLTQNGAVLFQDPTDMTTAFQIQNSLGAALFTADTANMMITIGGSLSIGGSLTLGGHLISTGTTPSIAAGSAACTTPTVGVSGNDTSGTITVTTGSGCASTGAMATITFASAYAAAPHVVLTPGSANAAGLNAYIDDSSISVSGYVLGTSVVPAATTTYQWNYLVVQ